MSLNAEDAASVTIANLLDQVVTMQAESVSIEKQEDGGSLACIRVVGGTHEIVCELGPSGDLISARVIEL